jgi:Na+/proline symporter
MKLRDFLRKEGQLAIILGFILLAINVLPSMFSMNQGGEIYAKYYEHALPIPFTWILVGILVLRFLILLGNFYFNQKEDDQH